MRRTLLVATLLLLCLVAARGPGPVARAGQAAGCAGSWLIEIAIEGRAGPEGALLRFAADGTLSVESPPVLPALPGEGETPLAASDGLGAWQALDDGGCAFEYVRLLAADDGVGLGTLNARGTATANAEGIAGELTYVRATGFGQTAASASGRFSGTSLSGPLLWLTPAA